MENFDLIEDYELEQEELDNFIIDYAGNIRDEDTFEEVLYKMNEQMNHIIVPLGTFLENEDQMRHYVRDHETLPKVIKSFEALPKAIEDESEFVQTIDYQLQKIVTMYDEVLVKAIDI